MNIKKNHGSLPALHQMTATDQSGQNFLFVLLGTKTELKGHLIVDLELSIGLKHSCKR